MYIALFGLTQAKIVDGLAIYVVIHFLVWLGSKTVKKTERLAAISLHYDEHAKGEGHQPKSVVDCTQDACQLFI